MILEVFSNLNDSMRFYEKGPTCMPFAFSPAQMLTVLIVWQLVHYIAG